MTESLEQRALRIAGEVDNDVNCHESPPDDWVLEFARRLMAEQGEPKKARGLTDCVNTTGAGVGQMKYKTASPPSDALDAKRYRRTLERIKVAESIVTAHHLAALALENRSEVWSDIAERSDAAMEKSMSSTADDSIKYSPHRLESTAMSDTPRTDAVDKKWTNIYERAQAFTNLAIDLERELAALEQKRREDVRKCWKMIKNREIQLGTMNRDALYEQLCAAFPEVFNES